MTEETVEKIKPKQVSKKALLKIITKVTEDNAELKAKLTKALNVLSYLRDYMGKDNYNEVMAMREFYEPHDKEESEEEDKEKPTVKVNLNRVK